MERKIALIGLVIIFWSVVALFAAMSTVVYTQKVLIQGKLQNYSLANQTEILYFDTGTYTTPWVINKTLNIGSDYRVLASYNFLGAMIQLDLQEWY